MNHLNRFIEDRGILNAADLAVALKEELGIKCRQEGNLFCFNYDQIESPKTHPVVGDCRGIVLQYDLAVAALTPVRFFNLGEALDITGQFDWENPINVDEKADGSFIKIYYDKYAKNWEIGTRGTCRAEVENYTGGIFRTMVLETLGVDSEEEFQEIASYSLWEGLTYCFELVGPDNRVVTPYSEAALVLLAVITDEAVELTAEQLAGELDDIQTMFVTSNVRLPRSYAFSNQKELVEFVDKLPNLMEGVVLRDQNDLRIKVKAKSYVAVHRLRGDSLPTPKRLASLVVTNETEEYLAYFPEERPRFVKYQEAWEIFVSKQVEIYNLTKDIKSQKDFALAIKAFPASGAMFQARRSGDDFESTLNSQREAAKVAWLLGAL
jgi:hypothetical protein